jgi:hypothetical protein
MIGPVHVKSLWYPLQTDYDKLQEKLSNLAGQLHKCKPQDEQFVVFATALEGIIPLLCFLKCVSWHVDVNRRSSLLPTSSIFEVDGDM